MPLMNLDDTLEGERTLETIDQRYPKLTAAEGQASVNKIKSDKTTVLDVGHLSIM